MISPTGAEPLAPDRSAPSAGFARATSWGEVSEGGVAPLRLKTALARFEAKLENVEGRGIQETLPGVEG